MGDGIHQGQWGVGGAWETLGATGHLAGDTEVRRRLGSRNQNKVVGRVDG